MKVGILRWEFTRDNLGRIGVIISGLVSERGWRVSERRRRGDGSRGRRGTKSLSGRVQECAQTLEGGETIEMESPLELLSGTQTCQLLDFSPMRPFGNSNLQNWKIIHLCCVKPVATGN